MPHVHITQCDDPRFLPFARSRLKQLRATGLAYASQQFAVDGATIHVRKEGEQEYIRITGGATGFVWMLVTVREYEFSPTPGSKTSTSRLFSFAPGKAIVAKNAVQYYAGKTTSTFEFVRYTDYIDLYNPGSTHQKYSNSNTFGAITGFFPYGKSALLWHRTTSHQHDYTGDWLHNYRLFVDTTTDVVRDIYGVKHTFEVTRTQESGGADGATPTSDVTSGTCLYDDITPTGPAPALPESPDVPGPDMAHFQMLLNGAVAGWSNLPVRYRMVHESSGDVFEEEPVEDYVPRVYPLTPRAPPEAPYSRRQVYSMSQSDQYIIDLETGDLKDRYFRHVRKGRLEDQYLYGQTRIAPYVAPPGTPVADFVTGSYLTEDAPGNLDGDLLDLRSIPSIKSDPIMMAALNDRRWFSHSPGSAFAAPSPAEGVSTAIISVLFLVDQKRK